jgi:DNA mismatch endonuclease (patch repair protein)
VRHTRRAKLKIHAWAFGDEPDFTPQDTSADSELASFFDARVDGALADHTARAVRSRDRHRAALKTEGRRSRSGQNGEEVGDGVKLYGLNRLRETLTVAESTRRSMKANRSTETRPEVALRQALWRAGIRGYRKNVRKLPGTPDIVFGPAKLAVFVHGCFWHGHDCGRARLPATNALFWRTKIDRNRVRHEDRRAQLERLGFRVLTVWECELKADLGQAVRTIREGLGR